MHRRYKVELIQPVRSGQKLIYDYPEPKPVPDSVDDYVSNDLDIEDERIHIVWDTWSLSTRRNDQIIPDYSDKIAHALKTWTDTERNLREMVRDAAFLPPDLNDDTEDINRLIRVLTDNDYADYAKKLARDVSAETFFQNEIENSLDMLREVIDVTGITPEPGEQTWMMWEFINFTNSEIKDAMNRIEGEMTIESILHELKGITSYPDVSPERQARNKKKTGPSADGGREQNNVDIHILVYNDLQARDLLNRGASEEKVLRHHTKGVPEGYWEEVEHLVLTGENGDIMDVYDHLEEKYDFHPEDRDLPAI